ncbi:MAG TPA: phage tail assembly protein [Sulfurospirillum arcachonense]|nr:phage tail assembly protein [Sulfurospirillum arcachonense]
MDTIKVVLPKEIEIDGKKITELEFREPLGEDMEDFVGELAVAGGDKKAMGKVITELAEKLIISHPLSSDDFRKMSGKNYMTIVQKLSDFLS